MVNLPVHGRLNWNSAILGISIAGFDEVSYADHRPNGDYSTLKQKSSSSSMRERKPWAFSRDPNT